MALLEAKKWLENKNMANKIIVLDDSTATVEEAATALKTTEGSIAKSLSFLISGMPVIIVVAGDKKIDNAKFKQEFGEKAKMIPYDDVEKYIGHAPGGVCPFGVKADVKVYLDNSLKEHELIYPACGTGNSAVKLSIEELEIASDFIKWIDVVK
jgi:prolyl-tRNA editing enzyme YbaK/EbsC (Cys-tRNA(Pro) deacylase)